MNMQKMLKRLSFASMVGMFLILLMGALVTKTESGRGCGDDWPLCNGRFVPAYTIESMIEYSHRFVVGVVGLILLATMIYTFRHSRRKDAKWYVSGALFFTLLQAVLGALAVVMPQSSAVLALHFGFSLISFAFTLLLYLVYTRFGQAMEQGDGSVLSKGMHVAIWSLLGYCYVVVYLGAFVRHTEAWGGCVGWPLCNGQVIPELGGDTGIVFAHRVAAAIFGILLGVFYLVVRSQNRANSSMVSAAKWSFIFVLAQILSGGLLTVSIGSDWHLATSLLHTLLISCLFGVQCYTCVLSLRSQTAEGSVQAYGAR
ncbi:COX15/CtaA family protein [Paenibacillus ginsengihumi]|uniref:COX15/CtaA family protein n=1 Tax=Paenibacillus ginsengihumi TaxID=431596 RepID=UPI00035DA471|nr:COX15/CtaA family protein [Paenibacillus ginsengihumi]